MNGQTSDKPTTPNQPASPPPNVSIRKAAPSDGAVLRLLLDELGYQVTLKEIKQRVEQLHCDPDCGILVLTRAGAVIGFTMVYTAKSLTTGRYAIIAHLLVTKNQRNLGMGRLLVEAAKSWTQQKDLNSLRVGSQAFREEAHLFYKKLGFSQFKTQHWFEYYL